jgi:hypothetical protein
MRKMGWPDAYVDFGNRNQYFSSLLGREIGDGAKISVMVDAPLNVGV